MYITMNKVEGGTAPIIQKGVEDQIFSNPLPQVANPDSDCCGSVNDGTRLSHCRKNQGIPMAQ